MSKRAGFALVVLTVAFAGLALAGFLDKPETPAPTVATVVPDACLEALDAAEGMGIINADFASVTGDYIDLVGMAFDADTSFEYDALIDKFERANKDVRGLTADLKNIDFAGLAADCRGEA